MHDPVAQETPQPVEASQALPSYMRPQWRPSLRVHRCVFNCRKEEPLQALPSGRGYAHKSCLEDFTRRQLERKGVRVR